jgi:hypothetical protein
MIEKVSDHAGVSPATNLTQRAASTKTLCHTPFGDVMVDELSTPNLAGIFGGRSDAKVAPAAAQPAVLASTAQPAVLASAAQAAVAAFKQQAAVVTSVAQAAVATSEQQQAAAVTSMAQAAADPDSPAQDAAPTAESVFGPNPWIANPTGTAPDGSSYGYNPLYFATAATAAKVAQMVGGKVVASNQLASAGGYQQQQPNQMVELANGTLINAGQVAAFYTHGYPQSYIDMLIQNETQET